MDVENCRIEHRPSVSKIQIYIIVLFGNGILMSFWAWTHQIAYAWCEFFMRWCVHIYFFIVQF